MQTIYLAFPDLATAEAALADYRRDGEWLTASHTHALDPIGTLYHDTGAVDGDGFPIMEALSGWHCNLKLPDDADISALAAYLVHPSTPSRVFAAE